ncbi:MAG: hypothetical protein IKB72_03470 [Ruminococcus sp.]|nr:hypothetical protein [Ruminococcus sp.]
MKKVLAILCVVLMVFSLVACNGKNNVSGSPELEQYISENKAELEEMIRDEMGMNVDDINIYVEGKGIVFDIKTSDLDEIPQEYKADLQAEFSEGGVEACEEMVEDMRDEDPLLKDLEFVTVTLRDSKGIVFATVSNK